MQVVRTLIDTGYQAYLTGFSALDRYFGLEDPGMVSLATDAGLIDLCSLFEEASFPGNYTADVAVSDSQSNTCFLIRSVDHEAEFQGSLRYTSFRYDCLTHAYRDPEDIYWDLRNPGELDIPLPDSSSVTRGWAVVSDAAILAARYGFTAGRETVHMLASHGQRCAMRLDQMEQHMLLRQVLLSRDPASALRILMESGFIDRHWPIIAAMRGISQSKDFHPEGDVWEHTLETFSYLKHPDLLVSLALLLHDSGKPKSQRQGKNLFDQHAQIGSNMAAAFLSSLNFDASLVRGAAFLIREHMVPSYIPKLSVYRTEKTMNSPLFPQLLELFRCDLSATFQGIDSYYAACEAYRRYLRHRNSPYRNSDGSLRRHHG